MQLKRPGSQLRLGLMAASCALLGTARAAHAEDAPATSAQPWQIDTGLLLYRENQGRVRTLEPVVNFKKDFGDEHIFGASLSYDSLTGGSPNGAIPSRKAQTFATPSGVSLQPVNGVPQTYTTASGTVVTALAKVTVYTTQPGQLPQDPNFHDQRFAGDMSWSQPFGTASHVSVGGHLSHELDFMSGAVNGGISHDFNNRNTTLSAGLNAEFDSVRPIGGAPSPGTDYTQLLKGGNKSKHIDGGLLGLTQVMSRRWLTQFNYSYSRSGGYLTDPYKILSVVDGSGAVTGYLFESRPDRRTQQSLYVGNKASISDTVLDASYRRGKDDWGIKSDTVDARWRIPSSDTWVLEPHMRWYRQSAADMYHLFLNQADPQPAYISADPRLAAFTGTTLGVKLIRLMSDNRELSLRLEEYQQRPKSQSSTLTQLQGLNLNPGLKVIMLQVGWRYEYSGEN